MSRDSIVILDPAGKIVWANRLAHEIAGLRPGGLLGLCYLCVSVPLWFSSQLPYRSISIRAARTTSSGPGR